MQDFADTVKEDLQTLQKNGIPVIQFGLQNEAPHKVNSYSHCHYDSQPYYETMKVMIPTLKEAFPNLHVHADSWNGQYSEGSKKIIKDEELLKLIDAWTFHRIGYNSDNQISSADYYNSNKGRDDIVVYNNEFEYFGSASDWNCINTAQSIMNWMTFENAPTWHWLHMLKPLGNSEASGFSLGFWRAPGDENDRGKYDYIEEGHWDYNYQNWNSIRGFLKYMPWDSVRYDVTEDEIRTDQRIMSYKTPEGRLVVVLTNRASDTAFTFNIDTGTDAVFRGYRYTPKDTGEIALSPMLGSTIDPTLPPLSIEFWVQDADETMKMADGVSLDSTELTLSVGDTKQLNAAVTPADAVNKNVTWRSEDYTVASVDENGKVTGLSEGETKIIAMAVSGSGQFRAECTVKVGKTEPVTFEDVQEGDWFYDDVNYVSEKGIMTGLKETIFGPAQELNRAEFATVLYRMAGSPDVEYQDKFPDVKEGEFYTDAVMWASDQGIVTGYMDTGIFAPSKSISREELAVMMHRYAKYRGQDDTVKGDLSVWSDCDSVSEFAKEGMSWAAANDIIRGADGKLLNPQGKANRAECAAIVHRYFKNIEK